MGSGFSIKCSKCNYKLEADLGYGMMFPMVYENTVKAIKDGKYGEEYKRFFEEHSNAAVNCEVVLAVCTKCGRLESVQDMSLYLPRDGVNPGETDYVVPYQLKDRYDKQCDYQHKCRCGGDMRIVDVENEFFKEKIDCPKCGGKFDLDSMEMIMWD